MDPQTMGELLPAMLLVVPLLLAVWDFFMIGKATTAATRY